LCNIYIKTLIFLQRISIIITIKVKLCWFKLLFVGRPKPKDNIYITDIAFESADGRPTAWELNLFCSLFFEQGGNRMLYIADETIEKWMKEDIPYLDLTTWALGIGVYPGKLAYYCRETTVLCGMEEVRRICGKLNVEVTRSLASGEQVAPNTVFFEATGTAADLHKVWKIGLNILEYASGIATRTRRLVDRIQAVNPQTTLVTTRKNFPGTKELAIKAVLAGGGVPHRLGLSETVLIFGQHRNFLAGRAELIAKIAAIKAQVCEKKVLAEVDGIEEALELAEAGIDGVQVDKVAAVELQEWVPRLRAIRPNLTILAAGGITESNAAEYAGTGVDALVTTAVYFGKPADLGTTIEQR
jgi:molybdenum transport protein